jgi:iron complex outermembrane receptor protein
MFQRTKICSGLLLAFGGSMLSIAPGAFAQDNSVQRVEITGSAIKRVDAETSVPVTVIKADDLKKQGVTTVEQILQNVSAVQVQQSSSQAVGAGTGGASFADLRGLGANKTLVLLNGRRIANTAFDSSAPDLNMIPFAAIERVEVLRDGASALYGTDAISGVINFITRKDYRGGTITVGMDAPQHPGGASHSANLGFGMGDFQKDGINVFGFIDFQKQNSIRSGQRNYFDKKFSVSSTTFPGTYLGTSNTVVTDSDGNTSFAPIAFTPFSAPACDTGNVYFRAAPYQCGENTSGFIDYVPKSDRISGLLKASVKLSENHTFGFEAFLSESKVNTQIAPVPYGSLYMHSSSPYYPGHGVTPLPPDGKTLNVDQMGQPGVLNDDALNFKFRDVFNGYREDDNTATQARFTASLEGNLFDWDYNVAATLNTNHVQDFLAHGYSNIDVIAPTDTNPNSATYGLPVISNLINPFGQQTPAGLALLTSAAKQGVVQYGNGTVQDLDGHASHDLGDWFHAGKPAAVALGFEARHERFLQSANAAYAAQVIASTGIDPATFNAGHRNVYAGFVQLDLPVLKSLDVSVAVRHDKYSDFGSTTNPKVGFEFRPARSVLVRGSYSTGFRAPSLYELNAAQTYGNSGGGQNDPRNSTTDANGNCTPNANQTGLVCNNQFEIKTGGNTELKPEKSKNATLGIVLEPIKDLTAEFDIYNITFTNQISTLPDETLFTPDGLARFPGNFHYNGNGQLSTDGTQCPGANCGYVDELNQNLGGVRTNGVDIALGYKMNAGSVGRLSFDLQSTWVHKFEYELVPGDGYIQNVGVFSNGSPVFRWQHNGTIGWNLDPFSLGWTVHYKSGYIDSVPSYKVSSYTTMDVFGTYAAAKGFSVTLGVKNAADSKAPYTNYTGKFQTGYDPRYADPTGRTYYARGTYTF